MLLLSLNLHDCIGGDAVVDVDIGLPAGDIVSPVLVRLPVNLDALVVVGLPVNVNVDTIVPVGLPAVKIVTLVLVNMTAVVAIIVLVVMLGIITNPIAAFWWVFIVLFSNMNSMVVLDNMVVKREVRVSDTFLAFFDKSAISKVVAP